MKNGPRVAIIGAGLTGLSCAYHLEKASIRPLIYEKAERIGGRVRTDRLEGFILDRGFQVITTSYPEFRQLFNLKALQLKAFDSGALLRKSGSGWTPLYHPLRHPLKWTASLTKNRSQLFDFLKLLYQYYHYRKDGVQWAYATKSTREFLEACGVNNRMVERFFRPFFGGVFLETELDTQAVTFMKRFSHFLWGQACLPAHGMEAIPLQLFDQLRKTTLHLGVEAADVDGKRIELANGEEIQTDATICALDSPAVQKLFPHIPCHESCSNTSLYFSAPAHKVSPSKVLMLGDGTGPVNTLSLNSCTQPTYAPKGLHLLCASVVDSRWQKKESLQEEVEREIAEWLNVTPADLRHLKTYTIRHALPRQDHPPPLKDYHHPSLPNVYIAGETIDSASINGALYSGRKIAERVIRDLKL